jgi:hypothetical protein
MRTNDLNQDHLVGTIDGRYRVSSPVVKYDPVTRTVTTMSGREYELMGAPGNHEDEIQTAWDRYAFGEDIDSEMDVTEEYEAP